MLLEEFIKPLGMTQAELAGRKAREAGAAAGFSGFWLRVLGLFARRQARVNVAGPRPHATSWWF